MAKKKTTQTQIDKELIKEMRALSKEVSDLKKLEFVKILKRPWKFLWFMFLKGLMVGFGSILGASVLVGLFMTILAQISFVPLIGDLVQGVIGQLELGQVTEKNGESPGLIDKYNNAIEERQTTETVEQN